MGEEALWNGKEQAMEKNTIFFEATLSQEPIFLFKKYS